MAPAERKATLENWAMNPALPKSLTDFAEKRLESIERGEEATNEQKNAGYDAATGGALTRHEAGLAGAKEEATAPYKIAANAIREGAPPVAVKPNEVVTTGAQLDPALTGFADGHRSEWAFQLARRLCPLHYGLLKELRDLDRYRLATAGFDSA